MLWGRREEENQDMWILFNEQDAEQSNYRKAEAHEDHGTTRRFCAYIPHQLLPTSSKKADGSMVVLNMWGDGDRLQSVQADKARP
jgi:hypothetical protein